MVFTISPLFIVIVPAKDFLYVCYQDDAGGHGKERAELLASKNTKNCVITMAQNIGRNAVSKREVKYTSVKM